MTAWPREISNKKTAKDMFNCLASAYFFGFLEGLHFSKSEEAALCAVGAQMLSLEEAAERLGRGSKPGDRQNDVAARLRMVAKEMWKWNELEGPRPFLCFEHQIFESIASSVFISVSIDLH